jgi:hypothetical protein
MKAKASPEDAPRKETDSGKDREIISVNVKTAGEVQEHRSDHAHEGAETDTGREAWLHQFSFMVFLS